MNQVPVRVQRRRVKGWRMPEGAVYVGRGSRWGNPFDWREGVEAGGGGERGVAWARGVSVDLFGEWFHYPARFPDKPVPPTSVDVRAALAGKTLACWCPDGQPCHADFLLQIANAPWP